MKKLLDKFGRKKLIIAVVIIILAAIGGIWFWKNSSNRELVDRGRPQMPDAGDDIIAASGLTATGMLEEEYELDFLETALYVEESYLSMGDTVEAGEAVFKVSGETLEQAREELKKAATEADLAYRQGVINYETQKSETESTYAQAEVNKEYAQAEYDSAMEQAKQEVDTLTKQVEEAQKLYDEYEAVVESDYYYTYYKVAELKQVYYENFTYLMELYEEWNIEELESQYPNVNSSMSNNMGTVGNSTASDNSESFNDNGEGIGNGEDGGMPEETSGNGMSERGMSGGGSFYDENSGRLSVYQMMDELVQKNGDEYESALENYEKDTKMATASLESARSELAKLQADLADAQLEYEKQMIAGKADYDTTLAESENAQLVYDTEMKKLDEELEALKDEKEEAEENLALFEETIGDGYFYAGSAGTVIMNMVRTDSYLSGDSMLIAYSDPTTVTVAASVEQADIAEIAVGDSAYVMINEYGNYEGVVMSIDPVASSDSRSSVTYTVTVELSGDIEGLASNLTAYVYFGMQPGDGEMPEGGMRPGDGEMPENRMQNGLGMNGRPEEMKQDE